MIVPVKSFALGKQRLAGALSPDARAQLGRALAEHVATTVVSAGLLPLVVTADGEVAEWSTLAGFPSIPDPADGLDAAATAGMQWAMASASSWIVLHSDLPLLGVSDLSALDSALTEGRVVIAPSADGGTSAIGSHGTVAFSFGVCSFHSHLGALGDPAVVTRPGLLLDIDSPADLKAALSTPRGRWLRAVIGGSRARWAGQNLY